MNSISLVDAFADRPFTGNPAAVCLLTEPVSESWMQSVAMEMNQSETAFVQPRQDGVFALRWFTPRIEVELCGHATLAAAHVIWTEGLVRRSNPIHFETASGRLLCNRRVGGEIDVDFPADAPLPVEPPAGLFDALGCGIGPVLRGRFDYLVGVEDERALRSLKPDFASLQRIDTRGFIVTALSNDPGFDFLSRFFAPAAGIDEDPVTGSAHCCLGPYWQRILGKRELRAYQASRRGGRVGIRVDGERVRLSGLARTTLQGMLCVT
jgi:PhzF family phenazine biosynthesis protein